MWFRGHNPITRTTPRTCPNLDSEEEFSPHTNHGYRGVCYEKPVSDKLDRLTKRYAATYPLTSKVIPVELERL